MGIVAGSIDEKSVKGELIKPTEHIFLEEKAGWYDLPEDGLGRFERLVMRSLIRGLRRGWRSMGMTGLKEWSRSMLIEYLVVM